MQNIQAIINKHIKPYRPKTAKQTHPVQKHATVG